MSRSAPERAGRSSRTPMLRTRLPSGDRIAELSPGPDGDLDHLRADDLDRGIVLLRRREPSPRHRRTTAKMVPTSGVPTSAFDNSHRSSARLRPVAQRASSTRTGFSGSSRLPSTIVSLLAQVNGWLPQHSRRLVRPRQHKASLGCPADRRCRGRRGHPDRRRAWPRRRPAPIRSATTRRRTPSGRAPGCG